MSDPDAATVPATDIAASVPLALAESFADPDAAPATGPGPDQADTGQTATDSLLSKTQSNQQQQQQTPASMDNAKLKAPRYPSRRSSAKKSGQHSHPDSPRAVEMILIDRSGPDQAKSKKMLRIDEHMNVTAYDGGEMGLKKAVVGVVVFCALVMLTTVVIIVANSNSVNEYDEVTALVTSLEAVGVGIHPATLRGWNAWAVTSPPNVTSSQANNQSAESYQLTYVLLRKNYQRVRLVMDSDVIISHVAGCYIKVSHTVHVAESEARSRSEVLIGSPLSQDSRQLVWQFVPESAQDASDLLLIEMGFDGQRGYSVFSILARFKPFEKAVLGTDLSDFNMTTSLDNSTLMDRLTLDNSTVRDRLTQQDDGTNG